MGAHCTKKSRYLCINIYNKTIDKILNTTDTKKTSESYNNNKSVTDTKLDENISNESIKKDTDITDTIIIVKIKSDELLDSISYLDKSETNNPTNYNISIDTDNKVSYHTDDDEYIVC
jgi:hypothetical protein